MARFWIINTCIPGETVPSWPSLFASEAEAEAKMDRNMRDEWERNAPEDEDGNPLPYPGDWRGAQEAIVENDTDGLWGRWEITPHDLHNAPSYSSDAHAPADPVKAEMLATLKAADRRLHDLGYSVTDPVTQQICAAIALAEGRA